MLWLTPAMDRLFIESAGGRRRFLDRLVLGFDPGHARVATRYETAMRERARLLKYGPRDPAWLDGLESEMAEAGVALARRALQRWSASTLRWPRAAMRAHFPSRTTGADRRRRHEDRRRCATLWPRCAASATPKRAAPPSGPHLTDLAVRHTQKRTDARDCSTGEQKALLISIVLADAWELARARDGHAPLLLLDEIAAHLDATRRAALFEEILALGAQAWMTGTDIRIVRAP